MRKTNKKIAEEVGISLAKSFYKDFINFPEYLGKSYKWKLFPDFCYKHGKVQCFLNFPYKVKNLKELEIICAKSAKKEAIRLMKDK